MKHQTAAVLVALGLTTSAFATTVLPTDPSSGLYDLGSFPAGSYLITATGVVDLVGLSGTFQLGPDGKPVTTVTELGYEDFNPNGSDNDNGTLGPAGQNVNIGAVIGSLIPNPATPADWFLIGLSTSITLNAPSHIYAAVNDTFYDNDTGSFEVNVTVAGVPDPGATLPLLGLALAGMTSMRRFVRSR